MVCTSVGLIFLYGTVPYFKYLNYIKKKEFAEEKTKINTKIVQRVDYNLVYFLYTGKYKTSTNNYSGDPVS